MLDDVLGVRWIDKSILSKERRVDGSAQVSYVIYLTLAFSICT
ncbi:hypothetical protein [Dehalobacter sp.]|nr:hypothetical protein [Dehalobacter sp.]MDJ0306415.1 hypothetical protein [Dehalobacter sp.]